MAANSGKAKLFYSFCVLGAMHTEANLVSLIYGVTLPDPAHATHHQLR